MSEGNPDAAAWLNAVRAEALGQGTRVRAESSGFPCFAKTFTRTSSSLTLWSNFGLRSSAGSSLGNQAAC
jgi:hypothetical protein